MQLLYYQAPISAVMLALFCPLFDDMTRLRQYGWNVENMVSLFKICMFFIIDGYYHIGSPCSPRKYLNISYHWSNFSGHLQCCRSLQAILGSAMRLSLL